MEASNFGSYQDIDGARLNRPAALKVLPWQRDGNGDHNVFMVPATWGLRSWLPRDRTLPRARRVWAKSLRMRQERNTEEAGPRMKGGRTEGMGMDRHRERERQAERQAEREGGREGSMEVWRERNRKRRERAAGD